MIAVLVASFVDFLFFSVAIAGVRAEEKPTLRTMGAPLVFAWRERVGTR
jgi:hypothetical protein